MCTQESLLLKLAELQTECQPPSFEDLFALAAAFGEVVGSCLEVGRTENLAVDVIYALLQLNTTIRICVNESLKKGLLQNRDKSAVINKRDKKAIALAQKLHDQKLRAVFLDLSMASSTAFLGCRMLKDDGDRMLTGWHIFVGEVRAYPMLARLAMKISCKAVRKLLSSREVPTPDSGLKGVERIDVRSPIESTETDAWGAWIQAGQEQGQDALLLVEECAAKLAMVSNFIHLADPAPWPIEPFYSLTEGASMTRIVREICRQELLPLSALPLKERPAETPVLNELCFFTKGILRKTKYLVRIPSYNFLCEWSDFSSFEEWRANPTQFMRKNWRLIPHSKHARLLRLESERIREALVNARLERRFSVSIREITPEALALLLVEASGLPHATSLFLTPLFRKLLSLLDKE
jgi:hypothetical protein